MKRRIGALGASAASAFFSGLIVRLVFEAPSWASYLTIITVFMLSRIRDDLAGES